MRESETNQCVFIIMLPVRLRRDGTGVAFELDDIVGAADDGEIDGLGMRLQWVLDVLGLEN